MKDSNANGSCVIMMTRTCWDNVNELASSLGYKIPYEKRGDVITVQPKNLAKLAIQYKAILNFASSKQKAEVRKAVGPILKLLFDATDVQ